MLFRFFDRRCRILTALAAVLILIQVYLDLRLPEYMNLITDAFLVENTDAVSGYGAEMVLCAAAALVLAVIVSYLTAYVSSSVSSSMRREAFRKTISLSERDFGRFSLASLITRTTNDVLHVQTFLAATLQITFRAPITTVWAVSRIMSGDPRWAEAVAFSAVIMVIVMFASFHLALPKMRRIQTLTDDLNKNVRESLSGMRVIRACNAEKNRKDKFDASNKAVLDNNLYVARAMSFSGPVSQMISDILVMAVYWMGAGIIIGTPGYTESLLLFSDMVVYATYAAMVLSSINGLIGTYRALPKALVSLKRIGEVLEAETPEAGGSITSGDLGGISFRGVSFRYPDSRKDSLSDVSFDIGKGETLAVIGPTGSGKSTLADLIMRFYDPDKGEILIGGSDIREYGTDYLRSRIGYVSQEPVIFSGTVRRNVNYGCGNGLRGDADVERSLEDSRAGFVYDLENGADSETEQRGRNFSGGQRQRISLARAFCRDPDIYVLDDTFSALDYVTESEIRGIIREKLGGKTKIIISQRIGAVLDADKILVLSGGRVAGFGTHEELMSACPLYREILESAGGAR